MPPANDATHETSTKPPPGLSDSSRHRFDSAELDRAIEAVLAETSALRHDLHRHPQLSYEETYANGRVRDWLDALDVPYRSGLAETGVAGWLMPTDRQAADRPAVALRADMDALPIQEQTGLPYASTIPGRMHACGHDGHTATLLGAVKVLAARRDRLHRPVLLIFQPAEEGGAGAQRMVQDGVLSTNGLEVAEVYGLHGWPDLTLGEVATRVGPLLAATTSFRVTLTGRGGHAAVPQSTADPIPGLGQLISALHGITGRSIDPTEPCVLTVAQAQAGVGSAVNVIPTEAVVAGTIRTLTEATTRTLTQRVREVAQGVAAAHGLTAEVAIAPGYPVTENHPTPTRRAMALATDWLGEDKVHEVPRPVMGGEDFSYYAQHVPANFSFIGVRPAGQATYPALHHPEYDFPDAALPLGMGLMCRYVLGA